MIFSLRVSIKVLLQSGKLTNPACSLYQTSFTNQTIISRSYQQTDASSHHALSAKHLPSIIKRRKQKAWFLTTNTCHSQNDTCIRSQQRLCAKKNPLSPLHGKLITKHMFWSWFTCQLSNHAPCGASQEFDLLSGFDSFLSQSWQNWMVDVQSEGYNNTFALNFTCDKNQGSGKLQISSHPNGNTEKHLNNIFYINKTNSKVLKRNWIVVWNSQAGKAGWVSSPLVADGEHLDGHSGLRD